VHRFIAAQLELGQLGRGAVRVGASLFGASVFRAHALVPRLSRRRHAEATPYWQPL
jgi:hypothetical protein